MTKLKVKGLKWKRLKVRGSIWIFVIYLFITSTPTTTLTPMWLYLGFFFSPLSFISNNNSNPTWFYLVFFFSIFYLNKNIFCFHNYLNLVWLNFWTFSLFNHPPPPKKTNLQKKNCPNFWELRWLFIFQ